MTICVENLRKDFIIHKRRTTGGSFWNRTEQSVFTAVKDISFSIEKGERVAFIGPNGAGKSTTLKMLSGILHPTGGKVRIADLVPWENRRALAYHIGLVFGQRSQLWYHLPVLQSFDLLGKIYGLENKAYAAQLSHLTTIFDLSSLLDKPVKSLSLGQRMRCEIAASLLHKPEILFLDEPTIGLDVTTKAELRDHLKKISTENGTTILLTSHDTDDIEEICDRVILINHGEKLIDTSLEQMRSHYLRQKQIRFVTAEEHPVVDLPSDIHVSIDKHSLTVEVDPNKMPLAALIGHVMQRTTVHDLSITDQDLEDVIKHIYREARP